MRVFFGSQVPKSTGFSGILSPEPPRPAAVAPELDGVNPRTFNCFMYAVGLAPWIEAGIAFNQLPKTANGDFLCSLLRDRPRQDKGSNGDLVVYSVAEKPEHAGRIQHDRVISKWGIGQLWDHRLYEVPSQYGSEVQFFDEIPLNIVRGKFQAFAQARLEAEGLDSPFE